MLNPYASHLGDRDPIAVIAATPGRLEALATRLGSDGLERSLAPGKWSAREILCHLADCEVVFAVRLRQALAEDHHMIQPFDQELWAKTYTAYSASEALSTFATVRKCNLTLLRSLQPGTDSKPLMHPERG